MMNLLCFQGMKEAFSNFLCSPVKSVAQVKDVVASPAGTAIIRLLLTTLSMTSIAGFAVYGADQGPGPLADIVRSTNEERWEEVHEFFATSRCCWHLYILSG